MTPALVVKIVEHTGGAQRRALPSAQIRGSTQDWSKGRSGFGTSRFRSVQVHGRSHAATAHSDSQSPSDFATGKSTQSCRSLRRCLRNRFRSALDSFRVGST